MDVLLLQGVLVCQGALEYRRELLPVSQDLLAQDMVLLGGTAHGHLLVGRHLIVGVHHVGLECATVLLTLVLAWDVAVLCGV